MAGAAFQFTDANFDQQAVNGSMPALVDFWAEWCGPCRMLGPTIEEIAKDYSGRVLVGKMDTDANQATAVKLGIQSIPTVMLFKNGKLVQKWVGVRPKAEFTKALDAARSLRCPCGPRSPNWSNGT
jgi:thioredoxin 1